MLTVTELNLIIEKEIEKLSYPERPKELYDPVKYILGIGGKRIRPILLLMSYQLFGKNINEAISPAIAIEIFHNFTLMHDDIMDNAPFRRGKKTVHKKWNKNIAILSGDIMIVRAYQMIMNVDGAIIKKVLSVFSKAAQEVCEGQQWDMNFEDDNNVTLANYMEMIEFKTAVLLAASLQIGGIIAGTNDDNQKHLYEFGKNIGIAFQLKDDMLDLFGDPEKFGKKMGGDVLANKKTFMYLKAIQIADKSTQKELKQYYNSNKTNDKVNRVKNIFEILDIKKHTIEMMKSYYIKAIKHMDAIESNHKGPLISLSQTLMERIS